MSQEDGTETPDGDGIEGSPVDDAVEVVTDREGTPDPDVVRATLESVSVDGVVTRDGVDDELAHLSKVVSTPETRAELAAIELEEAREAASDVTDLDCVADRLETFEVRLRDVEARVAAVGERLQEVVSGADGPLFETARDVRRVRADANAVHRAADELIVDVEEFERWVANGDLRAEELAADVDALDAFVDEVASTADEVSATVDDDITDDTDATGTDAPATAWADAGLRRRVGDLLVVDLRAEHSDLREWADRESADGGERLADLSERLDCVDDRLDDLRGELAGLERPEWTDRFGDLHSAFERELADFEPPVDWGAVQAALADRRSALSTGDGDVTS